MPTGGTSIRTVGNPVLLSLKGKTKGKRMLRKVVSTLFPQDLSVLDVVEGHLWKPSGKKSPMMRATRN